MLAVEALIAAGFFERWIKIWPVGVKGAVIFLNVPYSGHLPFKLLQHLRGFSYV
jgi:hypothetical protein